MKKIIFTFLILISSLWYSPEGKAQSNAITPDTDLIFTTGTVLHDINVSDYTGAVDQINPNPNAKNMGTHFLRNLLTVVIRFTERLLVPLIIVYLVWAGIQLVVNRNNEETFKEKTRQIVWTAVGFGLIISSFTLVDKVFFGTQGEILDQNNSNSFALIGRLEINGIVEFIASFAVAIGVLYLVISAIQLIVAGTNEDATDKAKKGILYAIIGITLIFLMYTIVSFFFGFDKEGRLTGFDLAAINIEIAKWANILLGFVAFFAVLAIIYSGVRMITHLGDEDTINTSKNTIKYAVIGIVLAFSAWTIVKFFVLPTL